MVSKLLLIVAPMILKLAFAHAEGRGTCFSNGQNMVREFGEVEPLRENERPARHALALESSIAAYNLADLENSKNGQGLLKAFAAFQSSIPADYEALHVSARRNSGLKYVLLKPKNPSAPWVFVFTGTENLIDWFSDLNLGRNQLAQALPLTRTFTDCEYTDPSGLPLSGHPWIITGHSLGGGLAQAFALGIQQARWQKGLAPAEIELVTFNAFGARELFDPAVDLPSGTAASNYFVTGDPVSRVGTHIGATLEIKMPPPRLSELPERHSIFKLRQQVYAMGGFQRAEWATPTPAQHTLNFLKKYGVYAHEWPFFVAESMNGRFRDLEILEEASNILAERKYLAPFDQEAKLYITNLAALFKKELEGRPRGILRDNMIERLNRLLARHVRIRLKSKAD